jgi:broad specificity phosphatase PhoE
MPLIHLIRHGETDGNRNHYVGRRDLPLNAAGLAQADALADRLAAFPITRIISSPLQRAQQTVRPLALKLGLMVELDIALVEIDFGAMQDLPKEDHALDLRKSHQLIPIPGGESLKNVWDRLLPLAADLDDWEPAKGDLALVGHYWSNRMLHGLLSGLSFEDTLGVRDFKPATGTVTAIIRSVVCGKQAKREVCRWRD